MLKVFYGNDLVNVRKHALSCASDLQKGGTVIETLDTDTYQQGIFVDAAGGSSLFGSETAYIIDTPSNKKDMYEDVIEHLEVFAESTNTFIVIESTLLAPQKKKFAKYAETIEEYKSSAVERFNVFAMADALSRKDKKSLWMLLQDAKRAGLSEEEIIGTLWWQLKTLRLAKVTSSAEEAGMKDFSYNKAKRAISKFKEGELETLSESLLILQHESRLGTHSLDTALEKWLLTL